MDRCHLCRPSVCRRTQGNVAAAIDSHHFFVWAPKDFFLAAPRDLFSGLIEKIDATIEAHYEEAVGHALQNVVEVVGDTVLLLEAVSQIAIGLFEADIEEFELLLKLLVGLHVAAGGFVEQGIGVGEGFLQGDIGFAADLQYVIWSGLCG